MPPRDDARHAGAREDDTSPGAAQASDAQRAAAGIFRASVAFTLTWLAFWALTAPHALGVAAGGHLALALCRLLAAGGALLALVALLAGGLPLLLAALVRAVFARPRDLWLLLVPIAAFLDYFLTNGIGLAAGGPLGVALPGVSRLGIGLAAALASTVALTRFVERNVRGRALYRLALLPGVGGVLAMGLTLLGVVGWGLIAGVAQPHVFAGAGGWLGLPVWLAWLGVVLAMGGACGLAAVALLRGVFSPTVVRALRASWRVLASVLAFLRGLASGPRPSLALAALRERYARGEIEIEAFAERVRSLLARELAREERHTGGSRG
jgi:hypothetical protein